MSWRIAWTERANAIDPGNKRPRASRACLHDPDKANINAMKASVSEFPKHPFPHVPQPQEPRPQLQPSTVFVYEKEGWEYKVLSKNTTDDPGLTEDELNALGKNGWELVGIIPLPSTVQFYLKRTRR
jgi:Domain of unknown function (DUF4177)